MPKSHPSLLLVLACLSACAAKPAPTEPAPPPPQVQPPARTLPSLSEERARPVTNAAAPPGRKALPSLEEERARQRVAPIALPDSPPAGISQAARDYPDWWLPSVQVVEGRLTSCGEANGVSFVGARQAALDQAVAALRATLNREPADLRTDRVTSVQSGGAFKVRVRVSAANP